MNTVNPSGNADCIHEESRDADLEYFSTVKSSNRSASLREGAVKMLRISSATSARICTLGT
jgi:hypothetical protein